MLESRLPHNFDNAFSFFLFLFFLAANTKNKPSDTSPLAAGALAAPPRRGRSGSRHSPPRNSWLAGAWTLSDRGYCLLQLICHCSALISCVFKSSPPLFCLLLPPPQPGFSPNSCDVTEYWPSSCLSSLPPCSHHACLSHVMEAYGFHHM